MQQEILNIEYHKRRLIIKALNQMPTKVKAYKALGITEKQLYNLIWRYSIKKDAAGKYYSEDDNTSCAGINRRPAKTERCETQ